jgi:uncharacterized membrane protein YjgN (DUF898 family)
MGYNGEGHLDQRPMPDDGMRLQFTGSGGEYFRIWIVNLLLSIITLGIYSAWAKVRRTQYFYQHTLLDGSGFEYHGNPKAILKGRAIAFAVLLAYNLAFKYSPLLGFGFMLILLAVVPWFVWKSMQFKLYNSSYRGIRFGFRGSNWLAYKMYLLLPLLSSFTFGLAGPFVHQRLKKFQHEESRFGDTHFAFDATVGSFYKVYLIGFLVAVGGVFGIVMLFGSSVALLLVGGGKNMGGAAMLPLILMIFCIYAWLFTIFPLFLTMMQNLIWNHTRLGPHQFFADLKWGRMTFLVLTNLLGIIFTFGLFMPFAKVRMLKYRVESIAIKVEGGLDDFVATTQEHVSATSEGMADFLDFDLSF